MGWPQRMEAGSLGFEGDGGLYVDITPHLLTYSYLLGGVLACSVFWGKKGLSRQNVSCKFLPSHVSLRAWEPPFFPPVDISGLKS